MKHLNLKIYGRVQGVFYRAHAQEVARERGLTGYARNEADGSVWIEAEGPEPVLEKFLEWAKRGPDRAQVDRVEVSFSDELKNFPSFTIF